MTFFLKTNKKLVSLLSYRHEDRKSMSTERTFKEVSRADEQLALCRKLCEDLAGDLKREDLKVSGRIIHSSSFNGGTGVRLGPGPA